MDRHKSITFTKTIPKKSYPKKKKEDSKLTREKAIISDYQNGVTLENIFLTYHIHHATLIKLLSRNNIKIRQIPSVLDKVKLALKKGDASTLELVKMTGVSHNTLKARANSWNLPRHKCRCGQGNIYEKIK